jgi:hypothetical protein
MPEKRPISINGVPTAFDALPTTMTTAGAQARTNHFSFGFCGALCIQSSSGSCVVAGSRTVSGASWRDFVQGSRRNVAVWEDLRAIITAIDAPALDENRPFRAGLPFYSADAVTNTCTP